MRGGGVAVSAPTQVELLADVQLSGSVPGLFVGLVHLAESADLGEQSRIDVLFSHGGTSLLLLLEKGRRPIGGRGLAR
jgi:hypothetical protein